MMKVLLSFALVAGASVAVASELDRDPVNQGLQGTVIVRVDKRDKSVSMAKSSDYTADAGQAQALAHKSSFSKLPTSKVTNELDRDGGASSWYWYCSPYNYNYNYYYYYGYQYQYYYSYNYGYYQYYYYNQYNGYWHY